MKKLIAPLVAFLLLLQCASKMLFVISYQLQKNYIAQNLCENRDNPAFNCEGRCYLKKQIRQQDEQEKKSNTGQKTQEEMVQICDASNLEIPDITFYIISCAQTSYRHPAYTSPVQAILQPPRNI